MIEIYPKYICINCGRIWRSGEIMVICPVCRSKGIKIKDGVNAKEVVKKLREKVINKCPDTNALNVKRFFVAGV